MKVAYKTHIGSFLLVVPLTVLMMQVNAQTMHSVTPKDNFTHFTADRTYADIAKLTTLTPEHYRNNPDFGKCFIDSTDWYEQIDKRTLTTRTYIGAHNEIITQNAYDNINYIDADGWMRAVNTKLKPYLNGWASLQQEIPLYLYPDASSALSIGDNHEMMLFNKNVEFNGQVISVSDYTVGDGGMYVKNVTANTDKTIRFGRGAIETDYTIKQPLQLNGDLLISENIYLPAGYILSENTNEEANGQLVVTAPDGQQVASIKAPLCYDNHHKNSIYGSYNIQKTIGGYKLEIRIPASWLNDPARQYPVIIDPLVVGKHEYYNSSAKIPSCLSPNFGSDTLMVTIPANITITHFYVRSSWYASTISKKYFSEIFTTKCGSFGPITVSDTTTLPGLAYGIFDMRVPLACCFAPKTHTQTFPVTMELTRDSGKADNCDTTMYGWYDPFWASFFDYEGDTGTFEAFIVGRTVQDSTLSFTPSSLCANQCTVTMKLSVYFGVPPYRVTHPWSKDTVYFGRSLGCDVSEGTASLTLTIPNCPGPNCSPSTLSIPPPNIIDTSGTAVTGLSYSTIGINATPNVTATPVNQKFCSGTGVVIVLGACVPGSTFSWTGSDGSSGTGDTIKDISNNNGSSNTALNFIVTATGGGCTGNPFTFTDTVTPFTVAISPDSATICDGNSVDLTTSGDANTYSWTAAQGLSCSTCSNPVVSPTTTTTYSVKGTNGGACFATDSIVVKVNPIPTLTVTPTDTTIIIGQSVKLNAASSGSVTWSPSTGLSSSTGDTVTASPQVTTTYTATVTLNSCTITEVAIVKVNASLYVPSAFTPSGEKNSELHVLPNLTQGIVLQDFSVYNRWGEKVFETSDISQGWDGTFNGKAQPMGTYVYYAKFTKYGQTTSTIIKGNVILIR